MIKLAQSHDKTNQRGVASYGWTKKVVPYVSKHIIIKNKLIRLLISVFYSFCWLSYKEHDGSELSLKFVDVKNLIFNISLKEDIKEFVYYNILRALNSVWYIVNPQ